ncbi:gametocyte-specific factor 1 homolog [Tribolium castaneum]|uniref:Gametocyte-specific factor 1-like Protein n=1 Tax=Tribolium castaneum TaxID=7070 RepID=D6W9B5_TRICA|nr:PREDICTED: gametocyte-specific factor 1 homolog [Tribolium castaneum]EEZ98474.1 Gametocyte-specific factor 1-like Protein [Tribolium castaneum]|eukprot:XP_008195425.2 PREDICTED: gametocyte-specific factor 1 homolog [Tribolium castaneum]
MEDLYDPEEKIMCPYNSSHHIRRCKMSFHLVKCKKNYGEQKMIPCDFNASHMIPKPELRYHHQICSDRKKIEAPIVKSQMKSKSKFPVPSIPVATEESWDNLNVATYDPKNYAESSAVLRHIDVESAGKRREFRLSERQRHNELSGAPSTAPLEPETCSVKLPPHRSVANVEEAQFESIKLEKQARKTYIQLKD